VERSDIGAWIGGPLPPEATYRGQRLGLPERGPGSMAGTGRRLVALFVDWTAARLLSGLLLAGATPALQSLLTMTIFAVEVAFLTWLAQASFGQRVVGIRVVGLSGRLHVIPCIVRTVLICVVIPPLVWDADGRGLHDRAVGSVLVRD